MISQPIFIPWSKQPSARSVALLALLPLPTCDGIQSVLDPQMTSINRAAQHPCVMDERRSGGVSRGR
jgi:hypothetical protein